MKNEKTDKELTSADFEAKIAALRTIVEKLESDISLEDGMKLFEDGIQLTRDCISDLDCVKARVDELKGELDKILDREDEEL